MRRSCTRRTRHPGRTGSPKHPNRIGVRTGVPAIRMPPQPATSPRRPLAGLRRKPHPQARWSVSRKAPVGRSRSRRVSPADGPRQARGREPDPSDSNLPRRRGAPTVAPRVLRSLSRNSLRRLRRLSSRSNRRGFRGRRRTSLGSPSSRRPGSRSVPRASGCRQEHLAATGTLARQKAPRRHRGPTTTRRRATSRRIGHRVSLSPPPSRRASAGAGIPVRPPNRRQVRPANQMATGANRVDAHARGTLLNTPTPPPQRPPRRRCHRRRLHPRRPRRRLRTVGR
jgi:hypothetical protein